MAQNLNISFALFVFAFLSVGCEEKTLDSIQTGDPTTLSFHTRSLIGGEHEGVAIGKLRLMLFDAEGMLVLNATTGNGQLIEQDDLFRVDLQTNRYSFCIVANETTSMIEPYSHSNHTGLNQVTTLSELDQVRIAWTEGQFTDLNVPLVVEGTMNVKRAADGSGLAQVIIKHPRSSEPDETIDYANPVSIPLHRPLSKASLYLRKTDLVKAEVKVTKVEVQQIPALSYAFAKWPNLPIQTASAMLFTDPSGQEITPNGGDVAYNTRLYHNLSSILLPEKRMTDPTVAEKATCLVIHATYAGTPTIYKVLLYDAENDYRLFRNTHYKLYVSISNMHDIEVHVTPQWQEEEVSGDIPVPYLNVSTLEHVITATKDKDGVITTVPAIDYFGYAFWTNRLASEVTLANLSTDPLDPLPLLEFRKQATTPDGMPDVSGVISTSITPEWVGKHYSVNPYTYAFDLKAGTVTRNLKITLRGEVKSDFVGTAIPQSGILEKSKYPDQKSFDLTAYVHDDITFEISVNSITGYILTSHVEKSKVINPDGTVLKTITVSYSLGNRNIRIGDYVVSVAMKDKNGVGLNLYYRYPVVVK